MATVERAIYYVADLEDKPGALLNIMQDLKTRNIGLTWLWGFGTQEGKAKLYGFSEKVDQLRDAWKEAGLHAGEGAGFFVAGEDRTGALIDSLEILAKAGVNINSINAIAVGGRFGSFIWVDASDIEKAASALGVL